jgi:hypothetical protein
LAAQYVVAKNPKDESWFAKPKHVFDKVAEFVGENSALHHKICVEFDACEKIKKSEDIEAELRDAIKDVVSDWVEKVVGFVSRRFIAGVVAYVALYIVRSGIKSYCRCLK